jgi:hypothetical protein
MSKPEVTPAAIPDPTTTRWLPFGAVPPGLAIPSPVVNGQWVKGVGGVPVWSAITPADVGLPKITTKTMASGPPASPAQGDVWYATAIDGIGTAWQFVYDPATDGTYPWHFVGGPHMIYQVSNWGTSAADSTWRAISGGLTMPRTGQYVFQGAVACQPTVYGAIHSIGISFGGTVQQVTVHQNPNATAPSNTYFDLPFGPILSSSAYTAGTVCTLMQNTNGGGTPLYQYVQFGMLPVRVS